ATGIWPLNSRNVFKRIPEIFDATEYTIDTTLLEYLKETRAPNPIQVKRSKKLRTEPGKSVCVDDISAKTNSPQTKRKKVSIRNTNDRLAESDHSEETIDTNQEKETEKNMTLDIENETYVLNEITAEVTRKTEAIKKVKQDVPPNKNISFVNLTLKPQDATFINNPNRLDVLCLHYINMYFSSLECDTNTQSPNVCVINENLKRDSQNHSFIAIKEKDLPRCLRPKKSKSKPIITSNKKVTPKELKNIIKSIKVDTKVRTQSALQMKIVKPKKYVKKECKKKEKYLTSNKNVSYSETSSEISENLSLADTDSEYESFNAYVSACLEEMNKENLEPDSITVPFGLSTALKEEKVNIFQVPTLFLITEYLLKFL
ncbi:jg2683, partial [Pararge aegeria aegeria]